MTGRTDAVPARSGFALVLALWGSRYGARHVNEIAVSAARLSPGLADIVLVTDRLRRGVDPRVRQVLFSPPYDEPAFFGAGYRAKLAVFSAVPPDPGMPCVFIDLDSVVVGDLGHIARLVHSPDDLYMLPPAGIGFGRVRRTLDALGGGRRFPVGNSSVLAFHSAALPNLSEVYAARYRQGDLAGGWASMIDDCLISWFARDRIRAMPTDRAVMLRREFLSRVPLWSSAKSLLPGVRQRRQSIAVVTMNGVRVKPETLSTLPEGAALDDGRGRSGRWSRSSFGTLWEPLRAASTRLAANALSDEND